MFAIFLGNSYKLKFSQPLHHGKAEDAAPTTYGAYEGGRDLCGPTEGSANTACEGQT